MGGKQAGSGIRRYVANMSKLQLKLKTRQDSKIILEFNIVILTITLVSSNSVGVSDSSSRETIGPSTARKIGAIVREIKNT